MPRLSSLTEKLITSGSKRSLVYAKTYSGTDFSSYHSTWTFSISSGTVTLRSSGLPYHNYGNAANTSTITTQTINRVWPLRGGTNQGTTGTTTTVYVSTNSTIGYWLNGVSMYSPSAGTEAPNGYLTFDNLNYDAAYDTNLYYSFSLEQDNAGAHWMSDGVYHYHDFNFDYAWLNGAGVPNNYTIPRQLTAPDFPDVNDLWYDTNVSTLKIWNGTSWSVVNTGEASSISYLGGSLTHSTGHSKILGWSLDGYPVYGPYGFNQPLDPNSGIRAMKSGYTLYSKVNQVPGRLTDGATNTTTYPLGIFVQDNYYAGTGDLDRSNGRYCVTPDYPAGTYAYFVTISTSTGRTTYPYIIGDYYKSTPSLGSNTATDYTNGGGLAPKQTS
jgi:hypothetical protein